MTPAAYARPETDFYATPEWVIARFLAAFGPSIPAATNRILEPSAGDGALLNPLREWWPEARIDAYDIDPRHPDVQARDFWFDDGPEHYDLVITNPPYVHAEAFVQYGLSKLNPGGHLALLLRLGFLGSQERAPLWRRSMCESIYVLSERPSFKRGATDFSEYMWAVWKQGSKRKHAKLRML